MSRDVLKSKEKLVARLRTLLSLLETSVVVDNTSHGKEDRLPYVALARKFDLHRDRCRHLNAFRHQRSHGLSVLVPEIAYRVYEKRFVRPDVSKKLEVSVVDFRESVSAVLSGVSGDD
ncbi:MAG: hypothetical protein ACYCOU_10250 [Sulfobacillus sp.]